MVTACEATFYFEWRQHSPLEGVLNRARNAGLSLVPGKQFAPLDGPQLTVFVVHGAGPVIIFSSCPSILQFHLLGSF